MIDSSETLLVYVTVPHKVVAHQMGRQLVEESLAACVNIFPHIQSIYKWDSQVEENHETVLTLKTTSSAFVALQKRIKELHPYECPCIVGIPITHGYPPYLEWIKSQTK